MEWHIQGQVTCTDFHSLGVPGYKGNTNADVLFITHQTIRIIQSEGQSNDRCDRCQGNVAFIKIETYSQYLLALVLSLTNDSGIRNGGRIRTSGRTGQAETGYFLTFGKAWQVVVLLLICAVMDQ